SDAFIVVSTAVEENMRLTHGTPAGRLRKVNAFIASNSDRPTEEQREALRRELEIPRDGILVFGCGTTDWRKGPDLFVEIAALAIQRNAHLYFAWIGGGEELESLLGRVRSEGLGRHVKFIGPRSHPRAYFAAGEAFL